MANLEIGQYMKSFKNYQQRRLAHILEEHPELAYNQEEDLTKIDRALFVKLILRTLKTIIMVTAISYFFAMAFKMLCDVQADYYHWDQYRDNGLEIEEMTGEGALDHFIYSEEAGLNMLSDNISDPDSILKLVYFSFTTLTTVGFGDLHPRSDAERLFIAFGMLIGVAVFSIFMSEFIEIVTETMLPPADGDEDNLAKFFGLLKGFNRQEEINYQLKSKIENYFLYRWANDRNQTQDETGHRFMDELPQEVQDEIMNSFLYKSFIKAFKFSIPKNGEHEHSRYTWSNQNFRDMMIGLMQSLEPITF